MARRLSAVALAKAEVRATQVIARIALRGGLA
jgi:hypothetical protein